MIILGIDPGTATTGYGLIKKRSQKYEVLDYGCILTPAKAPLSERLGLLADELDEIINKNKPDHLAVEELFFAANTKTAIDVGHARGVILLTGRTNGLSIFEYTPLQIKLAITGYGRADKKQMQQMVKILLALDELPNPDDAADALAIAICHGNTIKNLKS